MPKRGQTQPWKVHFQYDGRPQYKRAFGARSEAEVNGQEIADRGATVELYYRNPVTGVEDHVHTFAAEESDEDEEY